MGLTIGLALGSGGARGLAHAGVLEALEEAGVRADVVAGTSMGSIVGGLYAQNPDSALVWSRLEAYVRSEEFIAYWAPFVPREDNEGLDARNRLMGLYEFMQRKLIAVRTVTRPYLQTAEQLLNPLHSLFGPITFEELAIPLATVALDLVSGQCVTYTEGSLVQGIYASSCIPAVFPPVEEDGRIIVDGGGPYRVPIEACRQLGADFVIAVDIPAFQEHSFTTGLDMIMRSNTIARQRLNQFSCATADFVITPDVTDFHWADFGAGEACRTRGYTATRERLPRLQRELRWRRSLPFKAKKLTQKILRMT
ncbi:hypothetical protein CSB20_02845 [bacterium DOLZORAL124_64_63]|nr:MAG: hypothetical protein CSB20_02845 [bacterium DOLZORAL124_64_63]